jgi:hypothetical protein
MIVASDLEKEATRIQKKYNELYTDGPCEGYCCSFDMNDYYLIIDEKHTSINTIAHEVYHVVYSLLEDRDIKDEESGAWLCGMLMEEAIKFYKHGIQRPIRKAQGDVGGTGGSGTHNAPVHQPNNN